MRRGICSAIICAAAAGGASADTIEIMGDIGNSTEGIGDFTGSVSYTPTMGNMGTLLVSLTNTSEASNGGFITAFVFNINSSDSDAEAELLSGPSNFEGISDVNAQPFGMNFDAGASATNGQFEGGGNPSDGLAVGSTGMFEFKITADDAAGLTAADFFSDGPFDFNFIVRFRGFEDGGSDKVPGTIIPLPGPVAMAGAGLLGLAGLRRRRRA